MGDDARDTWRYLRVGMLLMIAGIFTALFYERAQPNVHCFKGSISAYYYSPMRAVFVAALVALGMGMVCLKGSTYAEDVLLNLAGMFAPVVAFVPTAKVGGCASSNSNDLHPGQVAENITNNVFTLLVLGGVGIVIVLSMLIRRQLTTHQVPAGAWAGVAVSVAAYAAALTLFNVDRSWFDGHAHNYSAALLFLCIIAVVIVNAADARKQSALAGGVYAGIAAAMVVGTVVILVVARLTDWAHSTLALEATLITLFAAFWATQTIEFRGSGLRRPCE